MLQNASVEPGYDQTTMNEDDCEEEVELPPPMKPISESLLTKDESQQQVCSLLLLLFYGILVFLLEAFPDVKHSLYVGTCLLYIIHLLRTFVAFVGAKSFHT